MLKLWLACRFPKKMIFRKKNKNDSGFSLIELLLALSIGSIVFLSLYSLLNFTINVCKAREGEDEVLLNGRYAIEYIKKEIESADRIIDIKIDPFNKIDDKYGENIGFVIMTDVSQDKSGKKYNYSTYYMEKDKIRRIALNVENDKYPQIEGYGNMGHNVIAEYILSFGDTKIDFNSGLIDLCFVFKKDKNKAINFNTKIKIRCPVVRSSVEIRGIYYA